MAFLINDGNVNWSGNFNVVEQAGADMYASTGTIVVNTTPIYTATWNGVNTKTIIGGLFVLCANGTAETITFQLQEYTGSWVDVSGASVTYTVSSSSLITLFAGEQNQNFIFVKFGSTHTETNGTNNYRIKITGSAAGTSTSIAYPVGCSSNGGCHRVYSTTQALSISDRLVVVGNSNGNVATVTINSDDSGTSRLTDGLTIAQNGILYFDNTSASCGIKLNSYCIVANGGYFRCSGFNHPSNTVTINIYNYVLVYHGGRLNLKGYHRYINFRTTLSSTANSGQANLVCNLNVQTDGWVAGDTITVATTDATNVARTELMTIQSVSANTITCTGNLSYQHLSGAEICNLTHNVKILNQSPTASTDVIYTWNDTSVTTGKCATNGVEIYKVEFDCKPVNTAGYGIIADRSILTNNVNRHFYIAWCSFRNTSTASVGAAIVKARGAIESCVLYLNATLGCGIYGAIYTSGKFGRSAVHDTSIIGIKGGTNGGIYTSVFSTSGPIIWELNNVHIYDCDNTAGCVGIQNNYGAQLILNSCKIYRMSYSDSGWGIRSTGNSTIIVANDCYFGSDGVNNIPNYGHMFLYGGLITKLNNCYSSYYNTQYGIWDDGFSDSSYPIYNLTKIDCTNHNKVAGRNISYQKYGKISDPTTGGFSTAYAKGASGNCITLTPDSATKPLYWSFKIPSTVSVAQAIKFYITKSSAFNGTVKVLIRDLNYTEILSLTSDITSSIPTNDGVGNDWTYQWSSGNVTPLVTGNSTVEVCVTGTAGSVFIDEITIV